MKKIKSIKAYCIVKKKNPKINILEIYDKKDIGFIEIDFKNEMLVEVDIVAKKC